MQPLSIVYSTYIGTTPPRVPQLSHVCFAKKRDTHILHEAIQTPVGTHDRSDTRKLAKKKVSTKRSDLTALMFSFCFTPEKINNAVV